MHYKLLCHWVQLSATYLLCCSMLCFGDLPMLVHRAVCGHFNSVEHSIMLLHHKLFIHSSVDGHSEAVASFCHYKQYFSEHFMPHSCALA